MLIFKMIFLFMHFFVHVYVYMPKGYFRSPGAEVTDSCKPHNMGAENGTLVLSKNSKCS